MQYTVEAGDSLSTIARDVLGDLTRWQEIASANKLAAPYVIYPGQVLQLPDPGTITLGPPTALPSPGAAAPFDVGALIRNPWVWAGVAAFGLWWWSSQD